MLHTPTREADELRTQLKAQINEASSEVKLFFRVEAQVKRMLAQLSRLRDIQRVNAQET